MLELKKYQQAEMSWGSCLLVNRFFLGGSGPVAVSRSDFHDS